jgi:uncharacterized protein YidB (DUF937 family)
MGLFSNLNLGDTLSGVLGSLQSAAMPALINAVLEKTQYHDINGLVAALQKGGLGPQVQSWLGNGANMPITEDQLKAILGNSQLQDFARQLGLPVDATLKILAQYLPELVDKASPNGTLQSHRT